jgi:hypothetical protein
LKSFTVCGKRQQEQEEEEEEGVGEAGWQVRA